MFTKPINERNCDDSFGEGNCCRHSGGILFKQRQTSAVSGQFRYCKQIEYACKQCRRQNKQIKHDTMNFSKRKEKPYKIIISLVPLNVIIIRYLSYISI